MAAGAAAAPAVDGTSDAVVHEGDAPARQDLLDSLSRADVGDVLQGTLGRDGLLDDLLTGGASDDDLPDEEVPDDVAPEDPAPEDPAPDEPAPENPVAEDPQTTEPAPGGSGGLLPGNVGPGRDPADRPGVHLPGAERPTDRPGADRPGTGKPGAGQHDERPGAEQSKAEKSGPEQSGPEQSYRPHADLSVLNIPDLLRSGPVLSTIALDRSTNRPRASDRPDTAPADTLTGVDLSWGARADVVPTSVDGRAADLAGPDYDTTILMSGLYDGVRGPSSGLDEQTVTARSSASLAPPGPTITGQLALVSLLLGLGIAALRRRRRPSVGDRG